MRSRRPGSRSGACLLFCCCYDASADGVPKFTVRNTLTSLSIPFSPGLFNKNLSTSPFRHRRLYSLDYPPCLSPIGNCDHLRKRLSSRYATANNRGASPERRLVIPTVSCLSGTSLLVRSQSTSAVCVGHPLNTWQNILVWPFVGTTDFYSLVQSARSQK